MNLFLLLTLILVLYLYVPLNRQTVLRSFKTRIDHHFPVLPFSVWVYAIYYILIPITAIILWNTPNIKPFLLTQIIGSTIAVLIWRYFPNGVNRLHIISPQGISQKLLQYIYSHDGDSNGLPSGHVTHSIIACFYLAQTFPNFTTQFSLLAILVSISTITTKQHYIADYVFSVPFSLLTISFTRFLLS